MASVQVQGKLRFYRQTATGSKVFLFGNSIAALGPSGSTDGTIQSTPEKWSFVPLQNAPQKVLQAGDRLVVTLETSEAKTLDASDCEFVIPITYRDGSATTLGSPDSSVVWHVTQAGDNAYVSGVEATLCVASVDQPYALGSNVTKAFASIEDNS
jgi:hypothetical protein